MSILYSAFINKESSYGHYKKVLSQCKAFSEEKKVEVYFPYIEGNKIITLKIFNNSVEKYSEKEIGLQERYLKLKGLKLRTEYFLYIEKLAKKLKVEILYARRMEGTLPVVYNVYKRLKKEKIKLIYEIPTYPFFDELLNRKAYIFYILDKIYQDKIYQIADLITFYGDKFTEKNYLKKSLKIENSISKDEINSISIKEKKENEISFIGVAHVGYWHGYDRLINSIGAYYKAKQNIPKIKITFNIVGDGEEEIEKLKKLSEIYNLEKNIIFHGKKIGNELENIYKSADIGVDSLARHRTGNVYNSSLKSKEYIGFGIPLIKSHIDDSLDGNEFVYTVSSDEKIFELKDIIDWYEKKQITKNDLYNYASKYMTWNTQIKKILMRI